VSGKIAYAAIYALRVIQLVTIYLIFHLGKDIIGHLATKKVFLYLLALVLDIALLIGCSILAGHLKGKYPHLAQEAEDSADRSFDTPVGRKGRIIFWVLLLGFLTLVIGYMMVCIYWDPPWLP